MKILWISWKSIMHPDAGGAEIVGHENAKALLNAGHSVTWVSLNPSMLHPQTKDGVAYQFIGKRWMMYTGLFHFLVFINYVTNWRHLFDVVIDEIHGPPLLTPLYVRKPILVVIHEVAGEIWKKTVPFPLSTIMQKFIEPLFFKFYVTQHFMIGAETTQDDLILLGISKENIHYVPYGVEVPAQKTSYEKEPQFTLIFLSALRPMKGFDRVYKAFKKIQTHKPDVRLWVVGDDTTDHAKQMKQVINAEGTKNISFFGKVSQDEKFKLLQKAHILVHGSYKEGWGLVVIEANAVGTPAVVFNVAGLRNSIKQGENGFLSNDEEEFIQHITTLFSNHALYDQMSQKAKIWSSQFSWDKATKAFLFSINQIIQDTRTK